MTLEMLLSVIQALTTVIILGLGYWLNTQATDLRKTREDMYALALRVAQDHPSENRMRSILEDVLGPIEKEMAEIKAVVMEAQRHNLRGSGAHHS